MMKDKPMHVTATCAGRRSCESRQSGQIALTNLKARALLPDQEFSFPAARVIL
jgi:hypothetical protein